MVTVGFAAAPLKGWVMRRDLRIWIALGHGKGFPSRGDRERILGSTLQKTGGMNPPCRGAVRPGDGGSGMGLGLGVFWGLCRM